MDVFSLLKFWRSTGSRDPLAASDFDSTIDDEESFFELVFTISHNEKDCECPNESRLSFRFSSPDEVYLNNKRNIFSFDSPNTKTPYSFPVFDINNNNNQKPEKNEAFVTEQQAKIGALLTRDNSLRCKFANEKLMEADLTPSKRFSKDVISKYLNRMKPSSYGKGSMLSKKRVEGSRLSDKAVTPSSSPASSVFSPKRGGAVFREVRKHLGKSRSASAILQTPARKSDDSELLQDGIRGAILHCKRSYNNNNSLSRSGSAPSNDLQRKSVGEDNDF
ncbi:membrane-associated kinase regulator 5-like [Bidens hawaiensis]|uniref:membrane-associated kinase regulator 5-like n=1 Tax=Bidens hawaiensis TaxID=980011 RepID=UPI00404B47D8